MQQHSFYPFIEMKLQVTFRFVLTELWLNSKSLIFLEWAQRYLIFKKFEVITPWSFPNVYFFKTIDATDI